MVIISKLEHIKQYYDVPRLNQSTLKKLNKGLYHFLDNQDKSEKYYEEKEHFIIGSACDTILLGNEGDFKKLYYVSDLVNKPSEVEMSITNHVFDKVVEDFSPDNIETIHNYTGHIATAIDEHEWQKNWKLETRINKICEKCFDYFEELKKSYGKQILSVDEYNKVNEVVTSLSNHPTTSYLFDKDFQHDTIEVFYQFPIYENIEGVKCKCLIDILVIKYKDDNKDQVEFIQPVDLKTMSGYTYDFLNSFKRFGYYIQAGFYTLMIAEYFNIGLEKIKNFQFVVESTEKTGTPLLYTLSDELMDICINGRESFLDVKFGKTFILQKSINGVKQLLEKYKYYEETDWKNEKLIIEKNNCLTLDWNGMR